MESTFDALARAVDDRVRALPEGEYPARLFGVRTRDDNFVLVPFWSGVAREIPYGLRPPDECTAIALHTGGWAAPMDDELDRCGRPSLHPQARRMEQTTLVYGAGIDVTVLRYNDEPPRILRDGVGVVPELMRACWARRRRAS